MEDIDRMFNEILSKIMGELGCVCIYAYIYTNEMRKKLIQSSEKCGFQKVGISDYCTLLYAYCLSKSEYIPKDGDIIWIFDRTRLLVWQKTKEQAIFVEYKKLPIISKENIENLRQELKEKKDPSLIICDEKKIYDFKDAVLDIFPGTNTKIHRLEWKDFSLSALVIKARIMAGDPEVIKFDAKLIVSKNTFLKLGDNTIIRIYEGESLPVKRSCYVKIPDNNP